MRNAIPPAESTISCFTWHIVDSAGVFNLPSLLTAHCYNRGVNFEQRYNKLNDAQREAVDTIDGPLLVVAGPGTGKTELLSMRAANILQKTDTLAENVLCLTFTDSGANAMRARLADIIGPDAYKVAIQTFHSFGTEIINQHREYFYRGAEFQPADDLSTHSLLTEILDELDYSNPLATKFNGNYTYIHDIQIAIGELKQAGLSSDELLTIVNANDETLDALEPELSDIFGDKISLNMLSRLATVAETAAKQPQPKLPPAITPLADELALSLARAIDTATQTRKTTTITAWRNAWLEKDSGGTFIFKDRKRHTKLRALAQIYFSYLTRMEQAGLYDYNDMVLNVVHSMELHADLKANLQEKYHYIMVDEFQDTNLAQLRILFNLTDNPVGDIPNVMAVGDDDQAIYSFQGADVNNIHRFRERYPAYKSVVLIDNYRSTATILAHAKEVIDQADGRLETSMQIDKSLTAHADNTSSSIELVSVPTRADEFSLVAESIVKDIKQGTKASDIAVIARRHSELVELVPYLHHHDINVNYERRDNILDLPVIKTLELLAEISVALFASDHELADSLLPELLAHPMYDVEAETIWRLSLAAHRNSLSWLETMMVTPELKPLAAWLIERAKAVPIESLELFIDNLVGNNPSENEDDYRSPFYEYYFGSAVLDKTPDAYLTALEALRTLRTKLREYQPNSTLHVSDFLEYIHAHQELGATITNIRSSGSAPENAINLLSAHKSKGLEFDTVYVINSIDSQWGERVRSRGRLISYPENLMITPNADTYDERLRLYFVAMTRAKRQLHLTYSREDNNGKDTLGASFLTGTSLEAREATPAHTLAELTNLNEIAWHDQITASPTQTMKDLLSPVLENYKLSATHLNNFLDISNGGPATFLMNNLLRFPQTKSASASYGTAMHATLQRAHNHYVATGEKRPVEDVLGDFVHELEHQRLEPTDFKLFSKRGREALATFLATKYDSFSRNQKTELSFARQDVVINDARLTGSMDLVDIDDGHIRVTDYKTGKPSQDWRGKSDFEKIKLHKYKQQLMFYQMLCENSRDYAKYSFDGGVLQFVEPNQSGEICALEETFTDEDLARFRELITAVWQRIMTLDFPDIGEFKPSYKGMLAFEQFLVDSVAP